MKDLNIAIEALKSKQIEMRRQIRRQEQLLTAILFETFAYYQSFRILANAANVCKALVHWLINFKSDKSDRRAGEQVL